MAVTARPALLGTALIAIVLVGLLVDPIPQDPSYHQFADARTLLGIGNFWNVVSNLPFVGVGGWGLWRLSRLQARQHALPYVLMCVGVVLVGLGSAYYHAAPSNATLLWDRLPMTVAFMALLGLLLEDRGVAGRRWLWILLAAGIGSVLYWSWTETQGRGDLRPYALVQFLPMLLIPLILVLFRHGDVRASRLCAALGLYIAAKLFEHFDSTVYMTVGVIGGHAIKHLIAAAAICCIVSAVPAARHTAQA